MVEGAFNFSRIIVYMIVFAIIPLCITVSRSGSKKPIKKSVFLLSCWGGNLIFLLVDFISVKHNTGDIIDTVLSVVLSTAISCFFELQILDSNRLIKRPGEPEVTDADRPAMREENIRRGIDAFMKKNGVVLDTPFWQEPDTQKELAKLNEKLESKK